MKRLLLGTILISILFFVSCQKEIDWGFGGNGKPVSQLLVKIKSQTGTDTTQVDYTYDAGKKLIREKTTGMSAGTNLDNDLVINRNTSGIITTTVQKAAVLVVAGVDSIVTTFNYSAVTSKYTSSVFLLNVPGLLVTDSAVYSYDAAGRISGDAHYLQVNGLPIPVPPVLGLKNYYIYSASGSNMDSVKQDASTTPGGPLSPVSSQAYNFDTKTNPLIILNEAVLLGRTGLYNANNTTRSSVANILAPANDFTMDYTYKYNTANKPDSSYGTRTPGGAVTATKYYYQ
jgi:hypothetical protein